MSTDGIPAEALAGIRLVFFEECEEHLAELQQGLELMRHGSAAAETIETVMRAAHSIKGGAGIFDLTAVVRVAHLMESALADGRKDAGLLNAEACKTLLRVADNLADMIRSARDDRAADQNLAEAALSLLTGLLQSPPAAPTVSPTPQVAGDDEFGFAPKPVNLQALRLAPPERWSIRFSPRSGLYASANEPLALFAELERIGALTVVCDSSKVPRLEDLAPDESYLSWSLILETDADEATIRDVFEFVADDCDLEISVFEAQASGPVEVALPAQRLTPAPTLRAAPTIRVDLERLDRLIDLVSELVINQSILAQQIDDESLSKASGVPGALDDLGQLIREVQDSVMTIRAQPVRPVFQRMARLAREMESVTGKPVRLITEGDDTEVDRTVIEQLTDPLTHMIRNAIDHGLERPDTRLAAGKPAEGSVRLTASHRTGRVIIEVSDDGAGINRERVQAKAIEAGLIPPDAHLSPEEVDQLIFEPGFSTAESVSDVSGRGVGMDVVRQGVQALGGRITVSSQPGRGATFSLSLPLTLAVLDGMLVQVRGQTLVAPLSALVETVQVAPGDICSLGAEGRLLALRGSHIPLIDLGEALGYPATSVPPERPVTLLVEDANGHRAALLVDEIHGQRQVVIKSLEASYQKIAGIAAATILGDGRVALILDVDAILVGQRRVDARQEAA